MRNLQPVGRIQQLVQLRSLYVRDWPKYIKEFHCLDNFLDLHRRDANLRNVEVYALPNLELGLFIIVDRYEIFMGYLESERSERLLKECLAQLAWFGGLQCASMPQRYFKAVNEVIQAKELTLKDNIITHFLVLSKEEALQFDVSPPVGFYLKSLRREDAQEIDDHWKWSEPGSLFLLERQITFNISVGLYEEESSDLVAWCVRFQDGLLAALQVKDSHQRRGFGALIVKEFSRRVALRGHDILTEIVPDNQASAALFQKLGFKNAGQCHWLVTQAENIDFQWPDGE